MNKQQAKFILQEHFGSNVEIRAIHRASGGCINDAYEIVSDKGKYFIKTNTEPFSKKMFEAEFAGLVSLQKTNTVRVPKPLLVGETEQFGYILMEYLDCSSSIPTDAYKLLGKQLAQMHLQYGEKFGYHMDNWIGSTEQLNTRCDSWPEFYKKYRLSFQLEKAKSYTDVYRLGTQLLSVVDKLFEGIEIKPSLLHGDLWAGNCGYVPKLGPVIFDPAVYYGHSEAELSIMKMFGGYPSELFEEYHKIIPKQKGFNSRIKLYQLYHYLNHLNIFGSGYKSSCVNIMKKLINELSD